MVVPGGAVRAMDAVRKPRRGQIVMRLQSDVWATYGSVAGDGDAIYGGRNRVRSVRIGRVMNWERATAEEYPTELLLELRIKLAHVALELNVADCVVGGVGRRHGIG